MTDITVQFTYSLPDERFAETTDLGKTATWIYRGPEKFYLYVYRETNKLTESPPRLYSDVGDNCPIRTDSYPVLVDATVDTLLASLWYPSYEHNTQSFENILLPTGEYFQEDSPIAPCECYNRSEIQYSVEVKQFIQPYPFLTSDITWDDIRITRDNMLAYSDTKVNDDAPDSVKQPWIDYRQKLRDIPAVYDGLPAYRVIWPTEPSDIA